MTTESTTSIAGDVTQSSYSSVPFLDVSNLPSELLDVYSDAILALPSVTGTSSYAASIVFLTLLLRTSITLPLTYWQRQRIGRVQRLVIPAAKVWMAEAKYRLRAEFRRAGKGYDEYVSALQRQTKVQLKRLAAQHGCRTLPTVLLPPLIHLPIFISTTLAIREACNKALLCASLAAEADEVIPRAAQLASEQLLWCSSLADSDPFLGLPLLVGLTALMNVEIQAVNRERLATLNERNLGAEESSVTMSKPRQSHDFADPQSPTLAASKSDIILRRSPRPTSTIPSILRRRKMSTGVSDHSQPNASSPNPSSALSWKASATKASVPNKSQIRSRVITNVLRFGSIFFVPIAAMAPVAVNLYWLSSNLFSIAQSLYISRHDRRSRTAQG